MRKLLILIFVTGVILDEPPPPAPPCVDECDRTHMVDLDEASLAETCRMLQNLLNCVKESCKDPEISKSVLDGVKNLEKLGPCDPPLSY